ncbi:MAG: hypothetical protein A2Y33_04070 [Spirochaetes bacterium GWF1_51_8]|nr:MAG: hypothetical protein A2Y33_04070 [Spirochaetes bacterium GWF1_51_8]
MKVLVVSDVVNKFLYSPQIKNIAANAELIISCGDLPEYYLDYLVSMLGKPLFYVCGNHDQYDLKSQVSYFDTSNAKDFYQTNLNYNNGSNFGGVNLDRKMMVVKGASFIGLEGSMRYNRGEHQYTEPEMKRKVFRIVPKMWWNKLRRGRFADVLVTHSPPFGIHDMSDLPHKGFQAFVYFIEKFRPKYLLHGHVHLYDRNISRTAEYMGTQIINCYDYQIIDIEIDTEREDG